MYEYAKDLRETEVWDRASNTGYAVWFTTDREEDYNGRRYTVVTVERAAVGDPATGEDVEVDLDHETAERLAEVIGERLDNGGML
jgi:hypothetical protein